MESLDQYVASIRHFGRITREREQKLSRIVCKSRNAHNVDEAIKELIQSNLFLVVSRAIKIKNKFPFSRINIMDLVAEGNIALMRSASLYKSDHKSNAVFSTYAVMAIDKKMITAIQKDRIIRMPSYQFKNKSDFRKLKDKYQEDLTDEIIMNEMNITKDMLEVLKRDGNDAIFLEDTFADEEGSYWGESLADPNAVAPYEKVESELLMEYLNKYITCLNEREQLIVRVRYLENNMLPYNKMALKLKLSVERIRQIDMKALRKIRRFIFLDCERRRRESTERYKKDDPIFSGSHNSVLDKHTIVYDENDYWDKNGRFSPEKYKKIVEQRERLIQERAEKTKMLEMKTFRQLFMGD